MTIQIELKPKMQGVLRDEAVRRGVSIEQCARALIKESLHSVRNGSSLTIDEEERLLDELAAHDRGLPLLPSEANSREWIYKGHD